MPPRRKKSSESKTTQKGKKNPSLELDVPFAADWESCNPKEYSATWNPAGTTPGLLPFSASLGYRAIFSDKSTAADLAWLLGRVFQYPIIGVQLPKSKLLTHDRVGEVLRKLTSVQRVNILGKAKNHWQASILLPELKQFQFEFLGWKIEEVAEALQQLPKSSELKLQLSDKIDSLKLESIFTIPLSNKINIDHAHYEKQKCDWKGLSQQNEINTLEINYGDLGKTLWPELAQMPNLEMMIVRWPQTGSGDRKKPVALPKLKTLSMTCIFDPVPDLFHMLAPSPNLETLKIDQLRLDDDSASGIGKMQSLKDVYLWNTPFTDNGMKQMCRWPDIRKLVLAEGSDTETPVTDVGFAPLGKLTTLESLQLQGFEGVSQKGWRALQALKSLKKFRVFTMCSFDGIEAIGSLPSLEHFSTNSSHFLQSAGCEVLKECKNLHTIYVSQVGQNPPPVPVEGISQLIQLRFLQLYQVGNLNNDALRLLSKLSNLEELIIHEQGTLNDKGFASLVELTKLKSLSLVAVPKINDAALKHLSEIPNLESLELRANSKITRVGYLHLMNCKILKNLSLTYAKNLTGDDILKIVQHHQLERLTISRCTNFTETHLKKLIEFEFLKKLELGEGLSLPDGAIASAHESRPEWGGYSDFWNSFIRYY